MFPVPILCLPVTHRVIHRFKADTFPLPPKYRSPPSHRDNMGEFYDQQVPYMVPPSVSGHMPTSQNTSSHLSTRCPPRGHSALTVHLTCALSTEREVTSSADALTFLRLLLLQQHKSRVEEPSHNRPLNDRKRKFVDTELAQDTEGTFLCVIDVIKSTVKYVGTSAKFLLFSSSVFSELFQDLSQLQEIWIAEGEILYF